MIREFCGGATPPFTTNRVTQIIPTVRVGANSDLQDTTAQLVTLLQNRIVMLFTEGFPGLVSHLTQ